MLLTEVAEQAGVDIDDVRLILMDEHPEYETMTEINEVEAEAVIEAAKAASKGQEVLMLTQAKTPEEREVQSAIVQSASDVYGTNLQIAMETELLTIADQFELRNAVAATIKERADYELAQQMQQGINRTQQRHIKAMDAIAAQARTSDPDAVLVDKGELASQLGKLKQDLLGRVGKQPR